MDSKRTRIGPGSVPRDKTLSVGDYDARDLGKRVSHVPSAALENEKQGSHKGEVNG